MSVSDTRRMDWYQTLIGGVARQPSGTVSNQELV